MEACDGAFVGGTNRTDQDRIWILVHIGTSLLSRCVK
jgi:hypothetical protein